MHFTLVQVTVRPNAPVSKKNKNKWPGIKEKREVLTYEEKNAAMVSLQMGESAGFDAGIMKIDDSLHRQSSAAWANRILILSVLGICYLTLFPFVIRISAARLFQKTAFLLGSSAKKPHSIDFFLNVLLFIPFGFGLSAQARKRGATKWIAFLIALGIGAATCYTVEFLQYFIPTRDSGWDDVISNTLGSVVGFILFELCGAPILEVASSWEEFFAQWISPRLTALFLVFYFLACFSVSAFLQRETRLSNWDLHNALFVGNDASGEDPWKGQVYLLQLWDRALPEQAMKAIAAGQVVDHASEGLLGSYNFSNSPPYQDASNSLPALSWYPQNSQIMDSGIIELGGKSWLTSRFPIEKFNQAVTKSSQFTIHVVCAPAEIKNANGHIVSISQPDDNVNLQLRQDGRSLALWFLNPLSATHASLAWYIPATFESNKTMDIIASYNGSDAFMYLNGNRVPRAYRLTPGASFMHTRAYIQTVALTGYNVVYETLLFMPAGILIGLAARKWAARSHPYLWMVGLGVILPSILLEILLASVGGGKIWFRDIALSIFFGLAGILLINADRRSSVDIRPV
jgi:glycopeptide antibiotics resistance protein